MASPFVFKWKGGDKVSTSEALTMTEADDKLLLENSMKSIYSEGQLKALLDAIPRGTFDIGKAADVARAWGPRIDNINLVQGDEVSNHINHMIGLLMSAINFRKKGYDIHLIEATTEDNIRSYKDIDLLMSKNDELIFVDYTNRYFGEADSEGFAYYSDEHPCKYDKICNRKLETLRDKSEYEHRSWVVRCTNFTPELHTLEVPADTSGPYGKLFQKTLKYVEAAHDLTGKQIDDLVQYASERLENEVPGKDYVKYNDRLEGVYDIARAKNSLGYNNNASMKYYRDVIAYLRLQPKEVQDEYSLWFHDKLFQKEIKPVTYIPIITERVIDTSGMSMPKRAVHLRNMLVSQGKKVPIMTLLLSLCQDNQLHPNIYEYNMWSPHVSDKRWGHCHMNLCKSKGDGGSFVEMSVDSAYGNGHNFCYGTGSSTGSYSTKFDRDGLATDQLREEDLEHSLFLLSMAMARVPVTGRYTSIVEKIIKDSLHPTHLGSMMKRIAMKSLEHDHARGSLEWASIYQMVCASLTSMREKYHNYTPRVKTGMKHSRFLMYVGEIGDRNALIFSSPSYTTNNINNCTCVIEGDLLTLDTAGLFIGKHHENTTRWFDLSHSNLDWGILSFSKTLSYFSMMTDVTMAVTGDSNPNIPSVDYMLGAPLMLMNNTRFNQVSGQTRHIFNNTCGYSNGTQQLYEKMDWYEPNNFIEQLYCLRLHKMSTLIQMVKSNRDLGHLIHESSSTTNTDRAGPIGLERTSWMVAMPNTSRWLPSDQFLYSSFYTSYAFATDRYNLVLSQAQVFNKQIKSRIKFVDYRKKPRSTDMSNLPDIDNAEDLYELMVDLIFFDQIGGSHKPCHLTVLLGAMNTLRNLHKLKDNQKLSEVLYHYRDSNRMGAITLASASNNRASVTEQGIGGVLPVRRSQELRSLGHCKKAIVSKVDTQTIKSYEALMIKHEDFLKNRHPIPHAEKTVPVFEMEYQKKPELTSLILSNLRTGCTKVWPTIYHNLYKRACVVARMIHKDDNKPREIAVMNIFLRLLSLSLEDCARNIRDVENRNGDDTNLIENEKKDDIAATTHRVYRQKKLSGKLVTNDNEDKSAWGPAQDPISMSITLAIRQPNESDRKMTMLLFENYTKKVFKIPDALALAEQRPRRPGGKKNEVSLAFHTMNTADPEVYDRNRQFILACEGMFQGTLSVASSCSAADCMRLSIEISKRMLQEFDYEATGHVTSDDSVHCKAYTKAHSMSKMYIVRKSLHNHIRVCRNFSYERNMSCSVHTDYVFELNSIFYTSDGRIVPSIKSRLSYVTYHYEMEFYQSAMSIVSRSAEYVRKEGSIMGAYWVGILNTFNHIQQFQLESLYRELGIKIYNIPLEIGGLPTLDPLMSVSSCPLSNVVNNYGGNFQNLLSFMTETTPHSDETVILSKEERDTLRLKQSVPRITRGAVTNLKIREHKNKRIIRESAMSIPRECYTDLLLSSTSANKAIINCFTREGVYYSESSTALRYSMSQTPLMAKIYHIRSSYLNPFKLERFSRADIFNLARNFSSRDGIMMMGPSQLEPVDIFMDQVISMSNSHTKYLIQMKEYRIGAIQVISQSSYMSRVRDLHMTFPAVKDKIEAFSLENRPRELGGTTDTHPIVYYEAINSYESRLRGAFQRSQKMNFSVTSEEINETTAHKLLATNFIEGSRIIPLSVKTINPPEDETLDCLLDFYLENFQDYEYVKGVMTIEDSIRRRLAPDLIDITSIADYRSPPNSTLWGGPTCGSVAFSKLKAKGKKGLFNKNRIKGKGDKSRYIVNRNIIPGEQIEFTHGGVNITQYPAVLDASKQMSEIVFKEGNEYHHYRSVWHGAFRIENDTSVDIYHYKDITEMHQIFVHLEDRSGVNILYSNNFPIFCIDKHKYNLTSRLVFSQNDPSLFSLEVVENLFYKKPQTVSDLMALTALLANITTHTKDDIEKNTTDEVVDQFAKTANELFAEHIVMTEEQIMGGGEEEEQDEFDENQLITDQERNYMEGILADDHGLLEVFSVSSGSTPSYSDESSSNDEISVDTYGREEFDEYDREEVDSISQLSSVYSCADNPLPHIARQEGLIFDQGITVWIGPTERKLRSMLNRAGASPRRQIFTLLVPEGILLDKDAKRELHKDQSVILNVLNEVNNYYYANHMQMEYAWFEAYVIECLRRLPGAEDSIQYYTQILLNREEMENEEEDDLDEDEFIV